MVKLDPEKCVNAASELVQAYYALLEQLGDPELTMEVYDGLRLLIENKIPCTMGFRMHSVYGEDSARAQTARERIYAQGLELCEPDNRFFELAECQDWLLKVPNPQA